MNKNAQKNSCLTTVVLVCLICVFPLSTNVSAQAPAAPPKNPLTISPDTSEVCADGKVKLTAKGDNAKNATWSVAPAQGSVTPTPGDSSTATFKAPAATGTTATAGTVTISATASNDSSDKASLPLQLTGPCPPPGIWGSGDKFFKDNTRLIVGFEQAGVSSGESKQRFFFDFFALFPLFSDFRAAKDPKKERADKIFNHRVTLWTDAKISSVPQQITATLGTFTTTFAQQVSNLKVNEVAQAAEVTAGFEVRVKESDSTGVSGNVILGGGINTPLTPRDSLEVFQVPKDSSGNIYYPTFATRYPAVKTDYVAFALADRDRFFREYYGWLRLRKHYLKGANAADMLPIMADLTYGVDESITRGRIRGGVLGFNLFFPFSWGNGAAYLFVNTKIKPSRAKITDPLILAPPAAGTSVPVPGPNVTLVTTQQSDRDYWRIGVAVDLEKIFTAWKTPSTPKDQTPTNTPTGANSGSGTSGGNSSGGQ